MHENNTMTAQSQEHEKTRPSNEAMVELPVGLVDEEEKSSKLEKREKIETLKEAIAELPEGLLDEDTTSSEFKKPEKTETQKTKWQSCWLDCLMRIR